MDEYISRQAFKEKYLCCGWLPEMAETEFDDFPAADVVEVRRGRWLDKGWDGDFSWQIDGRGSCWRVYECSECQCKTSAKTDYCPNCGARMDKEVDHEAD